MADNTTVTLEDGRTAEFSARRRMRKTLIGVDGDVPLAIRLDLFTGNVIHFELPESLMRMFALHGAAQKLADTVAGIEEPAEIVAALQDEVSRLSRGEWAARRSRDEYAGLSVLARAMCEFKGLTPEKAAEWLGAKTHTEKLALRAYGPIKAICERIEAEREEKRRKPKPEKQTVDTGALLAELDDGEESDD